MVSAFVSVRIQHFEPNERSMFVQNLVGPCFVQVFRSNLKIHLFINALFFRPYFDLKMKYDQILEVRKMNLLGQLNTTVGSLYLIQTETQNPEVSI